MLTLAFGPASDLDACTLFFLHAISSARSRIWIATPYFIPDDALLCALQLAAMRGVDVRVLVPAKRDHMLVWLASFFFVPAAATTGVKAYRYTDGFLHQKVLVLDDLYAAVGSANFDNRSFRLNFEATSLVADRGFNQQVAEMLERDMASATDVSNERMSDFPLWKRLGSRFARLFSPIL
jgi:cardiolipin synthase